MHFTDAYLERLLVDDCPYDDLTTEGLGIGDTQGVVEAAPKAPGIVAGLDAACRLFELRGARVERLAKDGDAVEAGQVILRACGRASELHAVYKTAQNVLEYASGVANRAADMVRAAKAENPHAQVALTRKHFPGTKPIVYAAVRAAGGIVHRYGLSDSVLVFDQHRVFCASPDAAVARLKESAPERKIAVEVDSIEEGLRYAAAGADIIQCERFAPETVAEFRRALREKHPNVVINVAGGVTAQNAAEYARAGADVLVTSWPYFGKPFDVKMRFSCPNPGACE